ncbi:helix-turn-helix transcriptional regulator [Nocardia sp. NPDC057353]|uniref:helix-turn-helix transcriptional regulator n=1 Tax=Nocardia sp. NPDC057353 TaxID=3346104 RepID=UPI003636C9C3
MGDLRCQACDVTTGRYAAASLCPTCAASTGGAGETEVAPTAPVASAVWLWTAPEAATALATRDLPTILRAYRRINGLSQAALAEVLGYDKSYVSMIETGKRAITDVASRQHIATRLALPAHVLGVTGTGDAEYRAMLQFGDSTVRLAEIARQSGRAVEAVNELWPLLARLEARAAEGHLERDTVVLLARARIALGVSLGTVLPEEQLPAAANWTGQAVAVTGKLNDQALHAHALRMHGNELRKAGHTAAAVARLRQSLELSTGAEERGGSLAFLCRAAAEFGDAATFTDALVEYRELLDTNSARGLLFQPFALREVEIRGLLDLGRLPDATRRLGDPPGVPAAPQWRIIEQITSGEVMAMTGEPDTAASLFRDAVLSAEQHRLPHQVQRAIRSTVRAGMHDLATECRAALTRIRSATLSR